MKEKSNPLDLWGFMFIHIMAKELPYFKFEPNQWENGNIQMFSHEQKGVFIDLCSMYWSRLGELPYKLAVGKICNGNATALDSLYDENIFTIVDGFICIDFLNEQLAEFENVSKTNSENARIGWEKRRNNATAKLPQSDRNAIREDKSKEDKSIIPINWEALLSLFNKTVNKKSKVISKKVKDQINARLKEGYSKDDIKATIKNCVKDDFHIGNNFKYVTLEYISRSQTIDKYSNIETNNTSKTNQITQTYDN